MQKAATYSYPREERRLTLESVQNATRLTQFTLAMCSWHTTKRPSSRAESITLVSVVCNVYRLAREENATLFFLLLFQTLFSFSCTPRFLVFRFSAPRNSPIRKPAREEFYAMLLWNKCSHKFQWLSSIIVARQNSEADTTPEFSDITAR